MTRRCWNQKGITLVELMVALAILGTVLAVGYGFFGFGLNSHSRGERSAIAQQNVRLVTQYIDRELQYATMVEVYTDVIPTPSEIDNAADGEARKDNYLFVNDQCNMVHRDRAGDRLLPTPSLAADSQLALFVSREGVDRASGRVLQYRLREVVTGYTIESQVHPENLGVDGIAGADSGIAIRYRKPAGIVNNPPLNLDTDEDNYGGCC